MADFQNFDRPVFLLQNNYFGRMGRMIQPCLDYCRENGHDFVDRSMTREFDPEAIGIDWSAWPGVVVFGSVGWMKRCQKSALSPYVFYDERAFSTMRWTSAYGERALNSGGEIVEVVGLLKRLDNGETLHVRPDSDDKAFIGAVYDAASWRAMLADRADEQKPSIPGDLLCFASPVREIIAEHRCWFVDGDIIEISTYRRSGAFQPERCDDPSVFSAARELAADHMPIKTVVMDIAETAGGYKVIEFNPINSSGWYAGDVGAILDALQGYVSKLSKCQTRGLFFR